jgi:Flp pilus assembly protein TadG
MALQRLSGEQGAVTAELAVALPAVMLVVGLILAVGQWQLQQQRLLVSAATIARALARGESQDLVDEWVLQSQARLEVSYGSNLVCARLSQASSLLGFQKFADLKVSEQQCAQKQ